MALVIGTTGTVVNAGIKPPSGCETARREAACAERTLPVARRRLQKSAIYGKLVVAKQTISPASAGYAARRFRRVCYLWVLVSRPRVAGSARARFPPHNASVTQRGTGSNSPA